MLKVATWNVKGVRARATDVDFFLLRESPDVVCFQETKAAPEQVPEAIRTHPGYWSRWHGGKGYSGVALMLKKTRFPTEPTWTHPAFDHEHRIVCAEAGGAIFASVYVPNGGKDFDAKMRFLDEMERWMGELATPLVLCGDLNVARTDADVHPKERRKVIGQLPAERAILEKIFADGYVDVARALDPANAELFTWWAPWRQMRERNIGWRLDYVVCSASLFPDATCKTYRDVGSSDHGPVVAELAL